MVPNNARIETRGLAIGMTDAPSIETQFFTARRTPRFDPQ
jgi:hypothetical protein